MITRCRGRLWKRYNHVAGGANWWGKNNEGFGFKKRMREFDGGTGEGEGTDGNTSFLIL